MALTDKDIVITPNRGQSADPKVEFKGASSTLGPQTISLNVYPTSNGTLSFEGSAGQLFSITNTLTGTIYSVNDVSGIPSIEVLDTGLVKLAQYSGNVLIGTATDTGHKVRVAGTTRIDGGGSQPLTISTSSSSPWAFGLIRTDTGADSKIFLHNPGSGSAWVFEHIPYFYNGGNYNVPLHNGNYGSYALPLSGGTLTGNLTMNGAGNSTSIIFGENTKQINVEGYWMMFKGHQNEGFRWQTTDGSTYTTRMQLTSSNLTLNTNGFIDFGPNTTWSSTLRVGGNGHGGSGRASVVTTDGNLHLDGGGSGTGLYLNYYVNGPIYATSSAHVVIHAGNYNSYAPTLTGGSASGTWGISITGNAATITSQANSATINASVGVTGNDIVRRSAEGYIYANHVNFNTGVENPSIANFITDNGDGWSRKSSLDHVKNSIRGVADGTWGISITGSAGSAGWSTYSQILDTRAGQYTPNDYQDYRATFEFTNQIVGDWHSAMTLQGWSNGYAAWQIIGGATTSTHENWYLRSGVNTTWGSLRTILHSGNYNSYAPTLTGGSASGTWGISITGSAAQLGGYNPSNYIGLNGNSYYQVNTWIQLNGAYGLYGPTVNSAHFYPNNGSYGAWRVAGSRNSWNGIEFDTNTGNVSLMIDMSGNTSGFHHNNYGWQMRWNNGTGYINKNAYGAGTEATILDSSNYTNYTNGVFLRAAGGNDAMNFNTTQYNTMYYAYIANSPNKPPGYNYSYGTIITFDPGVGVAGRAQFYVSHAGNDLIFRGGWNANDSWQTWNRVLTDQNYTSWAPSLTGSGASGTWGISITGSAASAASVPASGITGQVGMWTSAQRPGPYRLYRRDDNSDYSVQTYWTGARWRLYGYNGDTGHADTHVGYADSAGSTSGNAATADKVNSTSGYTHPGTGMYPFYNWGGSNGGANEPSASSYTIGISVGSHPSDPAYGFQIARNMWNTGLWTRGYDSGFGSWVRLLDSSNYNSYSPTLTGSGASGTWGINITGNAATATSATDSTKLPLTGGTVTGATYFQSNLGATSGSLSGPPLQAFATGGNSAFMSFHRSGNYAVNFGLDSDNVLRIGGWSASTNRWQLDMDGNNTIPGRLTANAWTTYARNYSHEWIEFPNYSGLYSPLNGAHFYPNNATYGSWRIAGARNGWYGIYFDSGSTLMMNSETLGFYRDGYGWQFYWSAGTGYVSKGNPGGGTIATILESSNYTSYSPSLTGSGASGTWNINITGSAATATDSTKVPLSGGTMTGTLFINSKLRVNNASGPSDSTYGTAADIPMHMSGNTRTQTTFLIENTVNSSIDYPVIVIRRTLTPVGSRFGGMIRFADKNSSGTEISSQIYSFNRLTSQDLFLDAGSGTEDRVVLRAGSSSSMQVAENFIMNVKAAIYAVTTPAALDIDCKQSNYFTKTINGDSTFTFSNVPAPAGFTIAYSFTLELTHTSGTVTWPASVRWPGNVLPSLTTGKTHLFMFVTDDGGSRWRGSFLSNYDN